MVNNLNFTTALVLLIFFLNPVKTWSQNENKSEYQTLEKLIMSLENNAMERWRHGDPMGWVEISAEEVIYVDPGLTKPIEGLQAYKDYLKPFVGKISYDISEYIDPKVKRYGDLVILTYNYRDAKTDENGSVLEESNWNTTEVYCFKNGEWKIVHTHWSYINHKHPEETEIPVLVKYPGIEYEGVLNELMRIEATAMERWRKGDPWGFAEICTPEVTYFDNTTLKRITGLDNLRKLYEEIDGKVIFDVMEFIDPKILVYDNATVLFYRFFGSYLNDDGSITKRSPWNCTEVYARINHQWRIVHTHFSLINGVADN